MYSSTSHLEKSKCHRFGLNINNLPIIIQGGKHFGQYFLAEVANTLKNIQHIGHLMLYTLDIIFRQITTFIKVRMAFVFGLQTL